MEKKEKILQQKLLKEKENEIFRNSAEADSFKKLLEQEKLRIIQVEE